MTDLQVISTVKNLKKNNNDEIKNGNENGNTIQNNNDINLDNNIDINESEDIITSLPKKKVKKISDEPFHPQKLMRHQTISLPDLKIPNDNINDEKDDDSSENNINNNNNNNNNDSFIGIKGLEWRTIIFIRHGNSLWNQSTDGSFKNPIQTAKAIRAWGKGIQEYASLKWNKTEYKHEDSTIVDTPLSSKGLRQAYNLSKYLRHHNSLRQQQKLKYLSKHQSIISPIKDAYRIMKKYNKTFHVNGAHIPNELNITVNKLEIAMKKIEKLMANALPKDPNDINIIDNIDDDNIMDTNDEDINTNNVDNNTIKLRGNNDNPMNIQQILDIICGKNEKSIIVASNLRRAISTCVISLWPRLKFSNEKVYLLSCLQEIGINVDTQTATEQFTVPTLSTFEKNFDNLDSKSLQAFYQNRLETLYNFGSKKLKNGIESRQNSKKRIQLFAEWVFKDHTKTIKKNKKIIINNNNNIITSNNTTYDIPYNVKTHSINNSEINIELINNETNNIIKSKQPVIIVFGHSKWFKTFYTNYLPKKYEYIGKHSKMANCAVVSFKFYYNPNNNKYGIAPGTLTTIYGAFGES